MEMVVLTATDRGDPCGKPSFGGHKRVPERTDDACKPSQSIPARTDLLYLLYEYQVTRYAARGWTVVASNGQFPQRLPTLFYPKPGVSVLGLKSRAWVARIATRLRNRRHETTVPVPKRQFSYPR